MSISFNCPNCQKPYRVEDAFAGRHVKCRTCGGELTVPRAGEFGVASAAEAVLPPTGPAGPPPLPQFARPAAAGIAPTPPTYRQAPLPPLGGPPALGVPPAPL